MLLWDGDLGMTENKWEDKDSAGEAWVRVKPDLEQAGGGSLDHQKKVPG